ncbi:MAG TPA: nucleotidyltransferase, partial [Planctomycetaceae bacterium]|nr:nucleotidyltransferase [Planctomycetaceae bacterium]
MNVTNIGALFGGESGLVRQILGLLRKRRIAAYVAIAPTAGSAWALSRYVAGC